MESYGEPEQTKTLQSALVILLPLVDKNLLLESMQYLHVLEKQCGKLFFYNDTSNWGTPAEWDAEKVAAAIEVAPTEGGSVESFSIWISNLHNNGATLNIGWDTSRIAIPFEVPTVAKASASIEEVMKNNPKHRDYYSAAVYYLQEGQGFKSSQRMDCKGSRR